MRPVANYKSLFPEIQAYCGRFKGHHNLNISIEFVTCANIQLTIYFERLTGIIVNAKTVSITTILDDSQFFYHKGAVSKLASCLYVNHNWNYITIAWRSKSDRIYELDDTDIDCEDIEFWFEGMDPLLYHKQLYPKVELPFQLKNLTYGLKVERLNMDMTVAVTLKKDTDAKETENKVFDFINQYNKKSEAKNREDGVIHNAHSKIEGNQIIFDIDTGFTGVVFLKKLLKYLSKLNAFDKVEIT